jgi:hypothetical protein
VELRETKVGTRRMAGISRFRAICKQVADDRETNKVMDDRCMASENKIMEGKSHKEKEKGDSARELGWDIMHEDDMKYECRGK